MAVKKRGLGRGLSALIPDDVKVEEEKKEEVIPKDEKDIVRNLDINLIEPNENQPRRSFDNDSLEEMANSILTHGLIQPIVVRKSGNGYQIIAGERRWRASQWAGLNEIPCLIKEVENIESAQLALIENIQRENLNPIEEAYAYDSLINNFDLTQDEVSKIVGKSRPYITNILRLLNLDRRVMKLIIDKELTSGHGRTLLQVEDMETQYELAQMIIKEGLSVRATERLIKEMQKKPQKKKVKKQKDNTIVELEDSLRRIFGTKVEINKGRNKGKIEIEYYSEEDLDRILDILSK